MGGTADQLDEVLSRRAVAPLFQPLVDLDRGTTAGYEALARGPEGPLQAPDALFAAADAAGRTHELDWLCREQAVESARSAGLRHPVSLFINAEPSALLSSRDEMSRWAAFGDLRCYTEITERAVGRDPAELLRTIEEIRSQDWGVALDDVGAEPDSLALLPLLRPDVIKLDMRLLHREPSTAGDRTVATVLHAALAQAQQSGAAVVAEGIETERHLELARAYGAQYGQGYLLGRPGPLPAFLESPPHAMPLLPTAKDRSVVPGAFAAVAGLVTTRRLTAPAVLELARQLLANAAACDPAPAVLASTDRVLPDDITQCLTALRRCGYVRVLGVPQPGRADTRPLADDDPGRLDLVVVVITPFLAGAVIARPTPDGSGDLDAVLTFARTCVEVATRCLVVRL